MDFCVDNNCNQLRQQAEALKQQGKTERDVFRFCMDKYTKTIYGEYGRELTEEDSLELYRCCLGRKKIFDITVYVR